MRCDELACYLDEYLESARFKDYCPNGLQVEGRMDIQRIVCGVTACQALIDMAVERQADAILVHHGWFWRSEDGRVTGFRRRRMATLLQSNINLLAYHLPLDAHDDVGNNAQIAQRLGWHVDGRFGDQSIGFLGHTDTKTAADLASALQIGLQCTPLLMGNGARSLRRIAWCSGGAQSYFEQAINAGADCFVSGEISEQSVHLARECNVPYIAVGHHASERYGVAALGVHLQDRFGLDCTFVDIENPV